MGTMRTIGAGAALAAMAMTAVPAEAGWKRGDHHRHHRADKVTTGDVIAGVALLGLIAAFAAKKPKPIPAAVELPPEGPLPLPAEQGDPAEAAAVDGCVRYVGEHYADDGDRFARVEQIAAVEPTANGFRVRGSVRVEQADGAVSTSRFRCSVDRSGNSRSLVIG